ncbi:VTT domain-containing protein [Streptomyces sp. NPDC046985]|uniref:DedA family protein n=1 Tax=Streptomyces sp. NPDC046985 TaxID=3155377 RepID=UPI00340F2A17
MMTLALGPSLLDPNYLLDRFGIWGLLLVVFAESGLLIGFFLPGDSLLFTCGLLITSHQMHFPLWAAILLICVAAILGDQAGFMFGRKVGPSLFNRPDSRLFKQENVVKAHEFFEKYGPKSLVLARFVPVVRTFTPIVAGVSGMRYRSFLTFNVIGGVLWGAGVTLLGSWLGGHAFVRNNIEAILILIVLVSVVPVAIEFLRARAKAKKAPAPAAPPQEAYGQQYPEAYGQQQPYQQPAMDDATTRLRRVETPHRPHPQQQPARQQPQPQPYDYGYDYGHGSGQDQRRDQNPYQGGQDHYQGGQDHYQGGQDHYQGGQGPYQSGQGQHQGGQDPYAAPYASPYQHQGAPQAQRPYPPAPQPQDPYYGAPYPQQPHDDRQGGQERPPRYPDHGGGYRDAP